MVIRMSGSRHDIDAGAGGTVTWECAGETRLQQFATIEIHHETEQLHHHQGHDRAPAPRHAEGHRLHRRGPQETHHRRGEYLDRNHAVQLQSARAGRARQSKHPRGRQDADGIQHRSHQRRHDYGHRAQKRRW